MGLTGNLKTMALPDILQWIAGGQKTGTLHIERRSIQKRIVVRDGLIFSSWSNDPRESLGQFLIRLRLVTEEQLFKALLAQEEKGRLFESQVTPVIMEGIRRVDEWGRIKTVLPSMSLTLHVQGAPVAIEDPVDRQVLGLAAAGKTLAEISLELRRSEFETAALAFDLHSRGLVTVDQVREEGPSPDPVGAIQALLGLAYQRLQEKRYDAAIQAYEEVLALDRLNQNAKKGIIAAVEARNRDKALRSVPLAKVPVLTMDLASLTRENFDPHEGFVLSRVNGQWDVQSILKLCPMSEEDALLIFSRLLERKAIALKDV